MDELRQSDLEREFPGWRFEVGMDRLPYASRPGDDGLDTMSGEDWTDLRDNPTALVQVEEWHPGWRVWRSVTGRWWYARKPRSSPPQFVRATSLAEIPASIEAFTYLDIPGSA